MDSKIRVLFAVLGLHLCLGMAQALPSFLYNIDYNSEDSPSLARNIRASAKFHWSLANKAQNQMLKAENDDDVDAYEEWLEKMRDEDEKWQAKAAEYEQLRDILEAKIRTGELIIEGFTHKYEKGTVESIIDHLTFRAKP